MKIHKAFRILFLGAWLVSFGSWFPIATVEDRALMHPDHRTDEFSRPLNIKGVVRYVTPTEEIIDDLATKSFLHRLDCLRIRRDRHGTGKAARYAG
jgi:hypothetical protein